MKNKDGKIGNWTYKTLNGGIQLNYLILTPVEKYPAGARLNGTFSPAFSSKMPNAAVTAPTLFKWSGWQGIFNSAWSSRMLKKPD